MRIRKKYQVIPTNAKLENGYSTSDKNGYTCDYMNNNVGIVDSGSNENGNYIKYADGTLIQYGKVSVTANSSAGTGGFTHYSGSTSITLPASFTNVDEYQITTSILGGAVNNIIYPMAIPRTVNSIEIYLVSSANSYARTISYIAIGKWK